MKKDEFVNQLRRLVEIRSVSEDRDENKKLVGYVSSLISKKAKIKIWSNNDADILLASNVETMSPDVAFLVHGDVVSGSDNLFKLKISGDKLSGRGVSDMKFSIPIGICLLNEWIEKNKTASFSFVVTTDEELGGFNGAKRLAEEFKFKPKLLIVPDGGDNFELVFKSKGVIHLLIESYGRSAHASEPWLGKSAITELIKLSDLLEKKYGKNSIEPNWNITYNIGQIKAGESTNQICDYGFMKVDFRFPERNRANDILKEINDLVGKYNLDLRVSVMVSGEATYTDPRLEEVKEFVKILERGVKRKIKAIGDCGASDARYFKDSPTLMIKPNGGEIHADGEWIFLSSCLIYYELISKYLERYK